MDVRWVYYLGDLQGFSLQSGADLHPYMISNLERWTDPAVVILYEIEDTWAGRINGGGRNPAQESRLMIRRIEERVDFISISAEEAFAPVRLVASFLHMGQTFILRPHAAYRS